MILFCILVITFGVYYFIPFVKRQNLNIIYYTMNIPKTEQIRFKDSKAAFAIGLDCETKGRFKAEDIFTLESTYINYIKELNGTYHKEKLPQSSHKCKYEDFYNNYNNSFDYLKLKNYECLDSYEQNLEGIYSDQIFSYYEFSVNAIKDTDETFNNIDEYLSENDCKLQIVYTDITIDLSNYKEPIKPFLNSFFIQINPTLFIKRNVFFMNQYLYDDDSIIAVVSGKEEPNQKETLFSRYEEYSLYIGLNREINRPASYNNYAKIYMRADLKKTDIRRTYQKITEFYADASSILVALYEFLIIIVSIINNFYAENSISKKLFIFKGIDNKYFNINKKYQKIKELVSHSKKITIINNSRNHLNIATKDFRIKNIIETPEVKKEDFYGKEPSTNRTQESKLYLSTKRNTKKINSRRELTRKDNQKINNKQLKISINSQNLNNKEINIAEVNKLDTIEKDDEENISKKENKNVRYNFNLIEIIVSLMCPCCIFGNLKIKNDFNDKATEFLYNKLDIIIYIRNIILLDILNDILLDDDKKQIVNFLSRPLLSLDEKNQKEIDTEFFYQNYLEKDFDLFYDRYLDLLDKSDKKNREKKLMNITKQKLEDLISFIF